jgi:hypothetical protein
MDPRRNRRRALPVLIAAVALGAATAAGITGCDAPWEDDEPTVTQTETVTPTPTEKTQTGSRESGVDREGNDIPPPPGSPAARFEEFCRQNPGACD